MKIVKGDLIKMALDAEFEVIAQGCNCFCTQKSGIAVQFVKHFNTDIRYLEGDRDLCFNSQPIIDSLKGDVDKLGRIDYMYSSIPYKDGTYTIKVVNCYTQYEYGSKGHMNYPFIDYEALTLCMRKINKVFKGKKVGLPLIGGGLAGGDRNKILDIFKRELINVDLTVVLYEKE